VLESYQALFEIGSVANELYKFDLRPIGGSLVILTPFWRMATGKSVDG